MMNPGRFDRHLDSLAELRTYVAIIKEGSLASAAATLRIAPNAVSRRLSVLEERFGRRLIHRTTRRLSVTDEGRDFYERCRRILDEVDAAERELTDADGTTGTLRIGIHPDMVGPSLLTAVGDMLAAHDRLSVELRVSSDFLEPIGSGLDLAIHLGEPPPSSLVLVNLGTLVWGMFATPGYLARNGNPASPNDLVRHECLRMLRGRRETHWELSKGGGRPRRFAVGGRFETTDGAALLQALHAGLGIGVQLRQAARAAVGAGRLNPVLPAWQWASTPLYALLPKGRTKVPSVRMLLDALRGTIDQLSRIGIEPHEER